MHLLAYLQFFRIQRNRLPQGKISTILPSCYRFSATALGLVSVTFINSIFDFIETFRKLALFLNQFFNVINLGNRALVLLFNSTDSEIDIRKFIETGCLAFVIVALSCDQISTRRSAYHVLARFMQHFEGARFRERNQVCLLHYLDGL